jgi:hypothetical protein
MWILAGWKFRTRAIANCEGTTAFGISVSSLDEETMTFILLFADYDIKFHQKTRRVFSAIFTCISFATDCYISQLLFETCFDIIYLMKFKTVPTLL